MNLKQRLCQQVSFMVLVNIKFYFDLLFYLIFFLEIILKIRLIFIVIRFGAISADMYWSKVASDAKWI